jgi:hypothetical protein
VRFKTEVQRRGVASSAYSAAVNPLGFMVEEAAGSKLHPGRPCLEIWPTRMTRTPARAVNCPQDPLTPREKASRQVAIHDLEDLVSGNLESIGYSDVSLMSLTATFRRSKEVKVAFYTPEEAREICKLLAARLGK